MHHQQSQALRLYRELLKASAAFQDSNVRQYALRRVKQAYREHQHVSDTTEWERLFLEGQRDLALVKRQAAISRMYPAPSYVTESLESLLRKNY